MKSIADLKRLREESLKKVDLRGDDKDYRIAQTGCIGLCVYEPIVEIFDKHGNKTTYVHVNPDKASEIFESHIMNGTIKEVYTIQNNRKD